MEFELRPSLLTWLIVGIMSVTFIVLMKVLTSKYYVRGVSELFAAA